jgi:RNase P/RNase MRP subunit POP5
MKLQPSLRHKKRYIVFEIQGEQPLQVSMQELQQEVERALLLFLGQLGVAKAEPMFLKEKMKIEEKSIRFVLKVAHNWVDECKSAMILIKKIKNQNVLVRSIITSGTLKGIAKYL